MSDKRTQSSSEASETKRRLLKGAAVAAPLLMTAASKPVMAGICTPSAWVSGNLSDHGQERPCGGKSPGYWKQRPKDWPGIYSPGNCTELDNMGMPKEMGCTVFDDSGTKFHMTSGGIFDGSYFGGNTLMQVCHLDGTGDPYQLGAHIVAALLNAQTIPNYGMQPSQVIEIYRQLDAHGEYTTSTGQKLGAEEVVLFIQNTFH